METATEVINQTTRDASNLLFGLPGKLKELGLSPNDDEKTVLNEIHNLADQVDSARLPDEDDDDE